MSIPDNECNSETITTFDLSPYKLIDSLSIGNENFYSTNTFIIDLLLNLRSVSIGVNSFTRQKNNYGNNESKSFHILNCESLKSIEIGEYSFSDFAGQFELKNLPALQSIQIGTIRSDSYNFYWSSFVIGGILNDIEYVIIRSS